MSKVDDRIARKICGWKKVYPDSTMPECRYWQDNDRHPTCYNHQEEFQPFFYTVHAIEALQEAKKKEPDKYIDCGDMIEIGYIEGKKVVPDCPCGKLKKYEDWIWNHSDLIAKYLVLRAEKEAKEAQDNLQEAKECEKAVERIEEISARNKAKRAKLAKEAEARIMSLGKREICLDAPKRMRRTNSPENA